MNNLPPKPVSEIWRPDLVRLSELTPARRAFRAFVRGVLKLIAKICLNVSAEGMENFPKKGPLLVVINHLGDADAPAIMSVLPFAPDALAGIEEFEIPVLGNLMNWYGVIWLHRGRADTRAIRASLDGLAEGRIIVIAPEGRYSLTGALEEGGGGAAFLAYKSGSMILPIAVTDTENDNVYGHLKKLQRARVHVKVGKMFKLAEQAMGAATTRSGSKVRQAAVDLGTRQIMQELAVLLPEKYQGAYSDQGLD
jgi:1-acyl-sn-glycerol-3-phosphate acyltransferase